MPQFRLDPIALLARQMGFAPAATRAAQVGRAEQLLLEIEPQRGYPGEFVVFRITGYAGKATPSGKRGGRRAKAALTAEVDVPDATATGTDSPGVPEAGPAFTGELFTGLALQHDLGLLVETVSDTLSLAAADQPEPVLSIDDVADRFGVTSKTIQRWRRKGLAARRFIFPDGKRRVGFRLACVEAHVARQAEQVARDRGGAVGDDGPGDDSPRGAGGDGRLAAFSSDQLDDAPDGRPGDSSGSSETREIVRRARRMLAAGHDAGEVARRVGRRVGRTPLAVRHVLLKHDADHPDRAVKLTAGESDAGPSDGDARTPAERRAAVLELIGWAGPGGGAVEAATEAWAASDPRPGRRGVPLALIAKKAGVRRVEAYRAVVDARAERLAGRRARFHDDPLYHGPGAADAVAEIARAAESAIGGGPRRRASDRASDQASDDAERSAARVPRGLPPYLADLYRTPLLTPAQERAGFLVLNHRKSRFARERRRVEARAGDLRSARSRELGRLEALWADVADARNHLVRSNLRLVVSVARRHVRPGVELMDLVSDGNVVLLRAVDGFDANKGNKFSTYATLALMKGYARSVPAMLAGRAVGEGSESGDWSGPRSPALLPDRRAADAPARVEALDDLHARLGRLTDREREVVGRRFGLDELADDAAGDEGDGDSPDGGMTLAEVGRRLGLSKHRVRQIEQGAFEKLRA